MQSSIEIGRSKIALDENAFLTMHDDLPTGTIISQQEMKMLSLGFQVFLQLVVALELNGGL